MKPLVIYHDNCTDGFAAAYCLWLLLGDEVEYLPLNYNYKNNLSFEGRDVYVLDFSLNEQDMTRLFTESKKYVWLDHHKTAFESEVVKEFFKNEVGTLDVLCSGKINDFAFSNDKGYVRLTTERSGAGLAAEYILALFYRGTPLQDKILETKDSISITDHAATIVLMVEDRDLWKFTDDDSRPFHVGLKSMKPWNFEQWLCLDINKVINDGARLLKDHDIKVATLSKQAVPIKYVTPNGKVYEGHIVNVPSYMASDVGSKVYEKSKSFCICWTAFGHAGEVSLSIRSAKESPISARTIAESLGGGGNDDSSAATTSLEQIAFWHRTVGIEF